EALAPHAADRRQRRGRLRQPADDHAAEGGGVALQVVVEQVVEGGFGRGGGQRVAAEGGDAVARQAVHQVPAGDHPADREAVAEPLGEGDHVGGDPVRAIAPEVLAGPPPARLHLVGDEQNAAGVEHLLVLSEQAVGGQGEAAHALDGLGDQARHLAGGTGREQVLQVGGAGGDVLLVVQLREGGQLPVRAVQVVHAERGQRRALPRQVAGD